MNLYKKYEKYNKLFFDGSLPAVAEMNIADYEFEILGIYISEWAYTIILVNCTNNVDKLETLVHEMIHVWQDINGYKLNHGKRFKKMARKIEKATGLEVI